MNTARLKAYLMPHSMSAVDLGKLSHEKLAACLFITTADMGRCDGYALVGHADVAITLLPTDSLVDRHVQELRAEQGRLQARCTDIDREVASMLAIENGVSA